MEPAGQARISLRKRILMFIGALVLLSLLGSTLSLYRIREVSHSLDAINQISIPLGRLLAQMQSDAEVMTRELNRGLGFDNWNQRNWRPRPMPAWIARTLKREVERADTLVHERNWPDLESQKEWQVWLVQVRQGLQGITDESKSLYSALVEGDRETAKRLFPRWKSHLTAWNRQVRWGVQEYERTLKHRFEEAYSRVSDLRLGLEVILIVLVAMSLLLLWLGERALRPLNRLTSLARKIRQKGLDEDSYESLPEIHLGRRDEVSQLSLEFKRMASALIEREKTVESQKRRIEENYRLLEEMGSLNRNILDSIETILIVTDLEGKIKQANPSALIFLGQSEPQVIGTLISDWDELKDFSLGVFKKGNRVGPIEISDQSYLGRQMNLRGENGDSIGAITIIENVSEEIRLQERLRQAENLATMGRMSAQVAHEVRNPLHSIGLEAELAMDLATREGSSQTRQSIQAILESVDRLEKITENYLRLSKTSSGKKTRFDLGELLDQVLATYAFDCESKEIQVDWQLESPQIYSVIGDRSAMEQALGNLFRNAIQAVGSRGRIEWKVGHAESGKIWIRIQDSGVGLSQEVREKLFQPFVTTKAQGTGLGLSFVKSVVDSFQGEIEVLPSTQGACFEIKLNSVPESTIQESKAQKRRSDENTLGR